MLTRLPGKLYGLLAVALLYGIWSHWFRPLVSLADLPQSQSRVQGVQQVGDYTIHDLQDYQGEFRILSREDYTFGQEAQFSPVDFALGWGEMAKAQVYSQVEISQSNRWYRWHTDALPIPLDEIARHSANMHIIPANAEIARQIRAVKPGDLVYMQGALVEIERKDGWHWRSSLSREDTGAGACELMRVDQLRHVAG